MKYIKLLLLFAVVAVAAAMPIRTVADSWAGYRIMLDPGHGGSDPGALGPTAPHEGELALRCANALVEKFKTLGAPYKLTRTGNVDVSLQARRSASVSYDPYIFCSIHLNAFNGTAHGTETWYYWTAGNSLLLANCVHGSLVAEMGRANRGVKNNAWTVITGSVNVPAILTEGLFVDNATEHNLIKTAGSAGFNKWVNGHLYGFYDRLKILNSALTNPRTSSTPPPPATPTIAVNVASWRFDCAKGSSVSKSISVTGTNLTTDITVKSNKGVFTVDKASLGKTGGSITVTFTPEVIGEVSGTVTLTSGSVSKTVSLTGVATAAPLVMEERWNYSEASGTNTAKGWDATKVRNMTFGNGRLYLVYNNSEILVVKSGVVEGSDNGVLGSLKAGDIVAGGTLKLCDVKYWDGHIIASNLAGSATSVLRVYVWDNDNARPRVLLETRDFGGATRIGDCIGVKGTMENGALVFAYDDKTETKIISYAVVSGVANPTPTVIKATIDGTTRLATSSSTRVYPEANGYWIDGKDNPTTFLDLSGKRSFYIDQDVTWGNAFTAFTHEGTSYAMDITYGPLTGSTDGEVKNYTNGRARLLQCDDGYTKAVTVAELPARGLSAVNQNTNCTSNVITKVTGTTVEAWVLVANQGIAYYLSKGGTAPTYTYEPIGEDVPEAPSVTVTKDGVAVSKVEMATHCGAPVTSMIQIRGSNLRGDIHLSLSTTDKDNMFTVTPTTLSPAARNSSATITYDPEIEGTHTAVLHIDSEGMETVNIELTGTATPIISFEDKIQAAKITEKWNFSAARNNLGEAPWFSAADPHSRSAVALNGTVYVLNRGGKSHKISAVNAATGKFIRELDMTGVSGGTYVLSSLGVIGNDLYASNYVGPAGTLKVYKWTNGEGAPTVVLNLPNPGIDAGEHMSTYYDGTSGRIAFCSTIVDKETKVRTTTMKWFAVTDGVVNPEAHTVVLEPAQAGDRAKFEVAFEKDGTFWVNSKDTHPRHYNADGTHIETLTNSAKVQGTGITVFEFGTRLYAAYVVSKGPANWANGAIEIVDLTDGVAKARSLGFYPSGGLGEPSWGGVGVTSAKHEISKDGMKVDFYVLVPCQGIAAYSYDGKIVTGVDEVAVGEGDGVLDASKETEFYTLSGAFVRRAATLAEGMEALPAGFYIARQGAVAVKVGVR